MKDIGLGPALYLLMLKAMAKLFVMLTVLNLPMFVIYYHGDR